MQVTMFITHITRENILTPNANPLTTLLQPVTITLYELPLGLRKIMIMCSMCFTVTGTSWKLGLYTY